MPHCIVEYSQALENQLEPMQLVEAVHSGAKASGLFEDNAIKSRAIPYSHYRTGEQPIDFVHVTVRILSGRDQAQRASLSQAVLAELAKLELSAISLTVEVRDMERESYAKLVR